MQKNFLGTGILWFSICFITFGYFIAFSTNVVFSDETGISFLLSNNIYTDSTTLQKNSVVFTTREDIQKFHISSECNIFSKLLEKDGSSYLYEIKFLDNNCESKRISFVNASSGEVYSHKYNILSEYDIYTKLLDYNSDRLTELQTSINKNIQNISQEFSNNSSELLVNNRRLEELQYNKKIVDNILQKRNEKYILPIVGKELMSDPSRIPNAGRPYRSTYTDGIHHGWDIGDTFGEPVVSIDDGIIIRVVQGFQYEDLNKIQRGPQLTYEEELKNLDILRGNQVWVKTMKGDVVFYSHLNEIYGKISEGSVVHTGQQLGTVGITGVPDRNYKDYHLHFAIHKNPYNVIEAGKYSLMDYMKWDWYFKGESLAQVSHNQDLIFNQTRQVTVK